MLVCKFSKTGVAAYLPHLGVMRAFTMAIRRAGLKVDLSAGFNPHELIYFSQPVPLGTASQAEYFCISCDYAPEVFSKKMNAALSGGFKILKSAWIDKNPNLAALPCAAHYVIDFNAAVDAQTVSDILDAKEYFVIGKNGKEEAKDVRGRILSLQKTGVSNIEAVLTCSNINLRADVLAKNIAQGAGINPYSIDIEKKIMYNYVVRQDLPALLLDLDEMLFVKAV